MNQTNLIVNYLPSALEEQDLHQLFSAHGEIESYKLVRDKHTGKSLCYGFVNYVSADSAQTAIETLNGADYQGKKLKVGFARPSSEAIKNSNLYVANLPTSYGQSEIEKVFLPFGSIVELNVLKAPQAEANGDTRGVAFVRFDTRDQALAAIAALHGRVIDPKHDKPAIVRFAETPEEKRKRSRNGDLALVANIPINGTVGGGGSSAGGSLFMPGIGPIRSLISPDMRFSPWYRPPPSLAHGSSAAAAAAAVAANQAAVAQSMLAAYQVPFPTPPYQAAFGMPQLATPSLLPTSLMPPNPICVFVYNLPAEADNNTLYRLFGPFGAISDVKAIRDYSRSKCKGFGFVNFTRLEDAWAAIAALNGATIDGCQRPLQVSFKTPKAHP